MLHEPDSRVTDPQALEEIALYGDVVIAASASEQALTGGALDEVLGVDRTIDLDLHGGGGTAVGPREVGAGAQPKRPEM